MHAHRPRPWIAALVLLMAALALPATPWHIDAGARPPPEGGGLLADEGPTPSRGASPDDAGPEEVPRAGENGRGLGFDFDILTEREVYEADVTDPGRPSVSIVATVRNNGTAIFSVRVFATVNLNGQATLTPTSTGLMVPQAESPVVVSVVLPESSLTTLVATLKIEGVCEQSTGSTDFKQVSITVKQWHALRIENATHSPDRPVEREMVQFKARIVNRGNGPSNFRAGVLLDGRELRAKADGADLDPNETIRLEPGKFFLLTAAWKAEYGHHGALIEAVDAGPGEIANLSNVMARDTVTRDLFVGINLRDWTPYILLVVIVLVAGAALSYRYRARLRPVLGRLRRRKGAVPPPEARRPVARKVAGPPRPGTPPSAAPPPGKRKGVAVLRVRGKGPT